MTHSIPVRNYYEDTDLAGVLSSIQRARNRFQHCQRQILMRAPNPYMPTPPACRAPLLIDDHFFLAILVFFLLVLLGCFVPLATTMFGM